MISETIEQIQQRLTDTLQANPDLYDPTNPDVSKRGLTSPSQVAAWKNFLNVIATEIFTLEQQMNISETTTENLIAMAPPETLPWVKERVLEFQYDAVTPQVVQINDDLSVTYPVVDASKRVITQCAAISNAFGGILVKVAAGDPLAPISGPEVAALNSYLDTILGGDINFGVINATADLLKLVGTIFYNGQYNAVIKTNVIAAINNYLSSLPFNGIIKISELIVTIKKVAGVTDVQITDAIATATAGGFTVVSMISGGTENVREYQAYSGYIVNDPANLFTDTLVFSIDNN